MGASVAAHSAIRLLMAKHARLDQEGFYYSVRARDFCFSGAIDGRGDLGRRRTGGVCSRLTTFNKGATG